MLHKSRGRVDIILDLRSTGLHTDRPSKSGTDSDSNTVPSLLLLCQFACPEWSDRGLEVLVTIDNDIKTALAGLWDASAPGEYADLLIRWKGLEEEIPSGALIEKGRMAPMVRTSVPWEELQSLETLHRLFLREAGIRPAWRKEPLGELSNPYLTTRESRTERRGECRGGVHRILKFP